MRLLASFFCCALIGCASAPEPTSPDREATSGHRPTGGSSNAPAIESEIGALDADAVEAVVSSIRSDVGRCFAEANRGLDLPVIYGDIEVAIRVKGDGSVRHVYAATSDVGHEGAERCILALHEKQTWPRPEGGDEGLARTSYGRDPEGRAPVAWTAGDLGAQGASLERALASCAREAGTAGISVTMYVDPDGNVLAAGVSTRDEQGLSAIDCAVRAAKANRYPSPGSFPAKVTVSAR